MQADDPRHGTYAGYIAHRNEGSDKCAPCRLAERRYRKRYELNKGATMTRLGEAAHAVILRSETMALARETGVSSSGIRRLKRGGPDTRVRAETRAAIEAAATVSLLGARRRLQALAVLGWSLPEIAKLAGIHQHNLGEIRNGNRKHYCRAGVADRIAAAYDELHMRLPEPGRGPTWTRQYAARHGWVPPLAWDDIDNPAETPKGLARPRGEKLGNNHLDPVVVERVLAGEVLDTTRAEKAEIVRRWVAGGRSELSLCKRLGWKAGRYVEREAS